MRKFALSAFVLLAACSGPAPSPEHSYGSEPQLPAPQSGALPTVNVANATTWPAGATPTAPEGFTVTRFADGLDHPRWLYILPNGDVLVAESSTQAQQNGGILGWIRNQVQRQAGALGESANRVTLLRDANHDGVIEERHVFAENLNQPIGMVLAAGHIYIANTDSVVRYPYTDGQTSVQGAGEVVMQLPHRDGDNGHWTRNLIANNDGTKLYVSVGSSSNIANYGMEAEEGRAAIWEFNPDGTGQTIVAGGLRNPVGMDWSPSSNALWVAVNERDELGDNLVPDYITSVQRGDFFGWPYSYWGQNVDTRVEPQNPTLVATARRPDYALGAHTASLGLTFYDANRFPAAYQNGAFIGQHGSWNRSALVGYKVVFVPFENGRPNGPPQDFLTGFLNANDQAQGRPVGVIVDQTGALLVADDVGNIVWRVAYGG